MSEWVSFIVPAFTAVGVLAILGVPLALSLRLRGYIAAIASVPAAFAVVGLSAIIAPLAGARWSLFAPLAVTTVLSIIFALLANWFRPASAPTSKPQRLAVPLGAAAVGGLAMAAVLAMSLKSPDAISQTFDANFHLNAVRHIIDTGSASPFDMDLASPGSALFYPTLWHGFVALVAQLSGASIPVSTNAVVFAVCSVVWPIGMVAFGRAVAGPSTRVSLISGVLSAAFPNFPLALVGYGVLYPNLLSFALVPYLVVGLMQILGIGHARRAERTSVGTGWLLALGSCGAAALSHPNAIHVTLLWILAPAFTLALRALRSQRVPVWTGQLGPSRYAPQTRIVATVVGLASLVLAFLTAWYVGRTSDNPWAGKHKPPGAVLDALGMTPHMEGHAWPVTILFLIGAFAAWRLPRMRWALGSAIVLLGIYIVADGFPPSAWRTSILAPWYSDPWRLSALVWLGVFPLAVLGASAAWSTMRAGILRAARMSARPKTYWIATTALALLFLLAATQGAGAFAGVRYVSAKYDTTNSALLSEDERALLERLSETVPEGGVVVNNPWNGGSLAYAIADRKVLVPHTGGNYDPRILELIAGIDDGTPRACELSREFDAFYVLDFGRHYVFNDTPLAEPYESISGIESAPALSEVDREGDAVLYRVIGCN